MSNTPQIRFAGYTDAWEQRKLGDMGETYTGLSGKTKEDFGHGNAKFVTYMNVFSNSIADLSMTESVEIDKKQNEVNYGDVFFTTSSETPDEVGMSSVWLENSDNTYLNSFCFGYRPSVKVNPYYMAYMLRSDNVRKNIVFLAQGISRYNISKNKMMEISVPLPNLEEQQKIGEYFRNLDTLITLHQRKCDALQKFKKSMLQKMFPQNGESVPEIRFAGFTDAWEQRKLSDMVERVTRKNENLESELPLTISAQYGLIDQNEFFDKRIASRDVSGYYLLKKGEFAYNKSTSSDAPWGAVKRLDRYEMGVLSTLYIVFALKENGNIDSDFLVSYYDTDCWHKGVQAIAAEGARNHGLLNITPADYFETVLTVPSDVKEQHQIGTFFAKLDSLITLHQREYFSLRFGSRSAKIAQNTLSWEQRKLGDHSEIVAGGTPNTGHPEYWNPKEIPWMSSGEINNKVIYSTDNMISKIGFSNASAKWVKEKSVLIALAGQGKTRGTVAISEIPLTTNQSIAAIQPDSFLYYKFLFQNLEGRYNELREVSSGDGTRGGLNKQIISDLEVLAPEIQEQIIIGDFLCGIDNLITLHQHKPNKKDTTL